MEKQKNEPLATEIIGDQQRQLKGMIHELKSLEEDVERLKFTLNELMELTENSIRNETEALLFANDQERMNMYSNIAIDYAGRISSVVTDLIIQGEKFVK